MTYKPKLIEVALPLATINAEAAREKSIRHGHPSTLHLWWARRPLAAARAVIWASLVDDPSGDDSLTEEEQDKERQRLFAILERLVKWENSNDPDVLAAAKAEIDRCFPGGPPPILDPFGGGGTIPLEAQRLGLTALSGDLNPVAVLIQKAMIEIPPRFAGQPPVHPDIDKDMTTWERAQGLAADVEAYGQWMREEAERRIGHLYPDATGPHGESLTPIAWIWARTVESPDPTWSGHVPLVSSWMLSNANKESLVWIRPELDAATHEFGYRVVRGGEPEVERTVKGANGRCLATGATIPREYIKAEGIAGRHGLAMLAIIAEGDRGKVYIETRPEHISAAKVERPERRPQGPMSRHSQYMGPPRYGLDEWWKLFTPRQAVALDTFSNLLEEVRAQVEQDASDGAGASDGPGAALREGGSGPTAYAEAVVTYLAFALDRSVDYWSTLATWAQQGFVGHTFGRQALPMTWDFAEVNPFSSSTGSWTGMVDWVRRAIEHLPAGVPGTVRQCDAEASVLAQEGHVVSTDPPYYDAVPYADISDYFYVWLRRNLRDVWPDECATLLTPKAEELVADSQRFGSVAAAADHFEHGMSRVMSAIRSNGHTEVPSTIYYAYKSTESGGSTGWSTFLESIIAAGLEVTATWPVRTEKPGRMRANKSNALASSVVLVCRPRRVDAAMASRGEFIAALRADLPDAVRVLQFGNIAPVDLAQSTIGPGIRVFSRFSMVVEADGSSMSVSEALLIINDVLGEVIDGEEAELDRDTRFAVTWYGQNGYNPGLSGDADAQARAKNTSLLGIERSGIGVARAGEFRLFERSELDPKWDPIIDERRTVWEATQYLVAALERSETEAAELLRRMGGYGDRARQLAYVLFQKATDRGWADEANAYNGLIIAWPTLQAIGAGGESQQSLL